MDDMNAYAMHLSGHGASNPMANRDYTRMRQMGIGDLLLENRIIFLDGPIHDAVANLVVMKMLFRQSENRQQDIHFSINSPGGSVTARLASGAAILMAGGSKGKRFVLPHAKMMIHHPYGQVGGQVSDIEIQAKEIIETRETLNQILAKHTGQPLEVISRDTERDRYLSPMQAKEYGLVDEVVMPKRDKTKLPEKKA